MMQPISHPISWTTNNNYPQPSLTNEGQPQLKHAHVQVHLRIYMHRRIKGSILGANQNLNLWGLFTGEHAHLKYGLKHPPPCMFFFHLVFGPEDTSSSIWSVASKASAKGVQHGISSKVAADSWGWTDEPLGRRKLRQITYVTKVPNQYIHPVGIFEFVSRW